MTQTEVQRRALEKSNATRRWQQRERFVRLCQALKGEDLVLARLNDTKVKEITGYRDLNCLGVGASYCASHGRFVERVGTGIYRFTDEIRLVAGSPPYGAGAPSKPVEFKPSTEEVAAATFPKAIRPEKEGGETKTPFNRTEAFKNLCRMLNGAPVNVAEITDTVARSLGWAHAGSCRGSVRYYSMYGTFVGPSVDDMDLVFPWREEFCTQALEGFKSERLVPAPVPGSTPPAGGTGVVPVTVNAPEPLSAEEELQQLDEQEHQLVVSQNQLKVKRMDLFERLAIEAADAVARYARTVFNGDFLAALEHLRDKVTKS